MNKFFSRALLLTACIAIGAITGCSAITPPPPEDPMDRQWTASDYSMTFGDTDPCEGFNRAMFAVSEFGVLYVVRPIGWLWGAILPLPVIDCVDNAATNLAFPVRAVSCMLQNRWKDSGVELSRFLINLTVGIGG
ncbi:MAG: VacJ family lipoprotein, partial [Lentisphaeria bacterium]|nr:VacJ family lipoprotein [Lentisphaeria bacterium]